MDRLLRYLAKDDKYVGFTTTKTLLNFLGINWWEKPTLWNYIYRLVSIIILILDYFGIMYAFYQMELKTDKEFLEMIESFMFAEMHIFVLVKIYLLYYNSKKYKLAIDTAENLLIKYNLKTYTGLSAKVANTYIGSLFVAVLGWLPYNTIIKGIPLKSTFPISETITELLVFKFSTWTFQALSGTLTAILGAAIDPIFLLLTNAIANLAFRLMEILKKIGYHISEEEKLIREAVEIIHVQILDLKEKSTKISQFLLLHQMVYTVTHVCLLVFCALKIFDLGFIISTVIPILFTSYFQLFLYCYSGELLTTTMENVAYAAYDNQWYETNIDNRKRLIIFMEVAKRPVHWHAFGIIKSNFETYLNAFKESFSYYVIINTFASEL